MSSLRTYIASFITNSDLVDVVMTVLVVSVVVIIIKIFAFGLFDRKG